MAIGDWIHIIIIVLMLGLIIYTFGSIILMVNTTITVTNPRNEAFCLDQGFSDWDYAGDVTGVNGSIVCIEKGNLKYFTYENEKYYGVLS